MTLPELLKDPNVIELIGAILAALWAWAKANKWVKRRTSLRTAQALEALELAVVKVHKTYTQLILEGRKPPRLTPSEKASAEGQALRIAKQALLEKGIELYRLIPPTTAQLAIRKAVNTLLH